MLDWLRELCHRREGGGGRMSDGRGDGGVQEGPGLDQGHHAGLGLEERGQGGGRVGVEGSKGSSRLRVCGDEGRFGSERQERLDVSRTGGSGGRSWRQGSTWRRRWRRWRRWNYGPSRRQKYRLGRLAKPHWLLVPLDCLIFLICRFITFNI